MPRPTGRVPKQATNDVAGAEDVAPTRENAMESLLSSFDDDDLGCILRSVIRSRPALGTTLALAPPKGQELGSRDIGVAGVEPKQNTSRKDFLPQKITDEHSTQSEDEGERVMEQRAEAMKTQEIGRNSLRASLVGAKHAAHLQGHRSARGSIARMPFQSAEDEAEVQNEDCVDVEGMHSGERVIVQFSAPVFYCNEEEATMVIEVLRLGRAPHPCTVHWHTEDCSGKAGKRYVAAEGSVTLQAGELFQHVEIQIIRDQVWNATLEFKVVLSNPEGAVLGRYLHTCRIRVIDNNCFPSDNYMNLIQEGSIDEIPKMRLLLDYAKLNWAQREMRRGTLWFISYDLACHLHQIVVLWMKLYIVDSLLSTGASAVTSFPSESTVELAVCAAIYGGPVLLLYWFAKKRAAEGLDGLCCHLLQENLTRRYLNCAEQVRTNIAECDIIMSVARDSITLVKSGYFSILTIVSQVSMLLFLCAYEFTVPFVQGQDWEQVCILCLASLPSLAFPFFVFAYARSKHSTLAEASLQASDAHTGLANVAATVVENFEVISGFQCRPKMIAVVDQKIDEFNELSTLCDMFYQKHRYFAPLLMYLLLAMYIIVAGHLVLAGTISIGVFVTTLDVYQQMAQSCEAIHANVLEMQKSFPALENIVRFLNMPTDLPLRCVVNRARRLQNLTERATIRKKIVSGNGSSGAIDVDYVSDSIPISLDKVKFSYASAAGVDSALGPWTLTMMPGTMIALVGARGHGKTTLLKLLGARYLHEDGNLFVPPHYRTFFVNQDPLFFRFETLHSNLTFGIHSQNDDGSIDRVLKICRMLGLSERACSLIEENVEMRWDRVLSQTDRAILNVARPLIANPEVLVIEKPTLAFDDQHAQTMLKALRSHVDEKGLFEKGGKARRMRRPRTCIFTAGRMTGCDVADQIVLVKLDKAEDTDYASVTSEMLR